MLRTVALVLYLGLCAAQANAQTSVPSLLDSVMSVDLLVKEFRAPLLSKLVDMTTNFIVTPPNASTRQFIGVGDRIRSCPQRVRESGSQPVLAQFDYSVQINEEKTAMSEVLDYYGCRGKATLKESIYTTGKNLVVPGARPYLDGTVSFAFESNIESRKIRYLDEEGQELFQFVSQRNSNGEIHKLVFQDRDLLTIIVRNAQTFKDVVVKAPSAQASLVILGSSFRSGYSSSVESFKLIERPDGNREFEVGDSHERRSSLDFQRAFNQSVVNCSLAAMKGIFKKILGDFPSTEFGGSNGKTQKFTEDLLLSKRRLENKDQLDEVLKTVTEMLEGISSGKIIVIDKRDD